MKHCVVYHLSSVNQLYDENVDPIHVLFPAKNGPIDAFYMSEEEMTQMNGGEKVYKPSYSSISVSATKLKLYVSNTIFKYIDGDRAFEYELEHTSVRRIPLGRYIY